MTKKKTIKPFTENQIAKALDKLKELMDGTPDFPYLEEMQTKQADLLFFYSINLKPHFNPNERRVGTLLICLIWGLYRDRIKDYELIPTEYIKEKHEIIEFLLSNDNLKLKQIKVVEFINMFMHMSDEFGFGLKKVRDELMPIMLQLIYVMILCFEEYKTTTTINNIIQFPVKKNSC